MPLTKQTLLLLALSTTVRADVNHDFHECCSTGWSMIPMEWFLLNVDVVGEEDTVNFYEDETQGGLVTVRTASITRDGPGGRVQELGVPGCGTFAFEYGSDGKLVDYTYDGDEAWDSCVPDGSSLTPPTVKPTAEPTVKPTVKPTARPTPRPTIKPTAKPTKEFPTCGVRITRGRYSRRKLPQTWGKLFRLHTLFPLHRSPACVALVTICHYL